MNISTSPAHITVLFRMEGTVSLTMFSFKKKTAFTLCMHVCYCICVSVNVYMCVHACGGKRTTLGVIPQVPFIFLLFWDEV